MKKILYHCLCLWGIALLNLPMVLINSRLVAIRAYGHKPTNIAPIYILSEVIFYLIWIIYGFINGKKSEKEFLISTVIYWGIASICLILLPKINFKWGIYNVLKTYSLYNFIPLYTVYLAFENIFIFKDNVIVLLPVFTLIIMSFIGYSFGKLYNSSLFANKTDKEY